MDAALLAARFVLAAVLAAAGVTKLVDRGGTRDAFREFGIPLALVAPLALILPVVELGIAAALIPRASAVPGGVAAAVLFGLFMVVIGGNLAMGRRPDCHCFGELHSAPIGMSTIARNAVFAGLSAFVAAQGPGPRPSAAVTWIGNLETAEIVGLAAILALAGLAGLQGWFLLNLLRQQGRVLLRLEALEGRSSQPATPHATTYGLPVGSPAPRFELPDRRGNTVTLESLLSANGEKPLVLVFSDPNCGPCAALLPEVAAWQREHAAEATIALVSRAGGDEDAELPHVLLQEGHEVLEAYRSPGTPSAVAIRPDGMIASAVAAGADAIRSLLSHAAVGSFPVPATNGRAGATPVQAPPALQVGEPAPDIVLPDLDRNTVALSDFRGAETVVVFWNPTCAFCHRMLPDLQAWEAEPPEGAPSLLFVSQGSAEENRAMGLRSTIVLDEEFSAGSAFGAWGTPSAVLVDANGRVGSELAIGSNAVLRLFGTREPR